MYQLPELMSQLQHSALTRWIWGLGLLLATALFIALFSRRIAPRFPLFTNLIGFGLIRSVLFYFVLDPLSLEEYSRLFNFFFLVETTVRLGFAVELIRNLERDKGGWNRSRLLFALGIAAVAAVGTWITLRLTPPPAIPLNGAEICYEIVGILIFIASFRTSDYLVRTIAQGWGLFSIISLISNIGRAHAEAGVHLQQYAGWSYAFAGANLVAVIFWLVTLKPRPEPSTRAHLKAPA